MKTLKIASVSEIKTAENGNSYVVVASNPTIEGNTIIEGHRKAFFADQALLEQVKPGMVLQFEVTA